MDLRTISSVFLATSIALTACGEKEKKSSKDDESAEDDDKADKKEKKEKKDKKGKSSAAPSAEASAKAPETPTATPTPTPSTPAEPPPAANPLATFFASPPDPAMKFLKQKQIPNKPVWIQVMPYWDANTDRAPDEEPWTDLELVGKDKHATIHMWTRKTSDPNWDRELSNNCAWSGSSGCKFDAPVDGTLGEGIKMKIAQGTAEKNRKPSKVWWMRGEMTPGEELAVFVSLRSDVWAKLEGEQLAMLKSVKIAGPAVK